MNIELTEPELKLVLRMAEANDSGGLDRRGRLGALRTRTTLLHKLYEALDEVDPGAESDDSEDEE